MSQSSRWLAALATATLLSAGPAGWLDAVRAWLTSHLAPAGSTSTATSDAGPEMDPDGLAGDAGWEMDPNGLTGEEGCEMDPNG